ncbi:ester cyclase [Sphingomonas sp. GlSt437]|uniref:ester cyclase n=1 Tax=Sphingomonas sp. GlSt437 TaxID=3389970 RepID=UPI003A88E924
MPEPNRALVTGLLRRQIIDLWNDGRLDTVDRYYAPDVIDHMPVPGQTNSRAAMKQVVADFRAAIPDLRMRLLGTIACGELGVDFWTLTGTHRGALFGIPASNKLVRFSGIDMIRVANGQIVELWHVEEILQFLDQIGSSQTAFGAPVGDVASIAPPTPITNPGQRARHPDPRLLSDRERRILSIAKEHIEQIWARGDAAAAYRLYAPDVVDHMPAPGQRPGIPGIVDVLGWLREAVPDLAMTIEDYVVEGDLAADRWVMRGTHTGAPLMGVPARGNRFEINGMDVIRVRDDFMISDVWHVEEFASLRRQIMA